MATISVDAWQLARSQHWVISRNQLVDLGFTASAIRHRLRTGRLRPVFRAVYAVGRPELTQRGRWMAAVLRCGEGAALSHEAAGAHWGILRRPRNVIDISGPALVRAPNEPIAFHQRRLSAGDVTRREGIPVTTPVCTLVDLATRLTPSREEAAVNEADSLGLIDPEALRRALDEMPARRPGAPALRTLIDQATFALTDSELERRFLRIVRQAGLPKPLTQQAVNGFRVDFYWPDLELIVETDSLRYHRTPAKQTRDRLRDQVHTAAGFICLRFTHRQITFEPAHVVAILAAVARGGRPLRTLAAGGTQRG
jgi:very-short-patch-repair endonuclease